jgi:hypothetical protein
LGEFFFKDGGSVRIFGRLAAVTALAIAVGCQADATKQASSSAIAGIPAPQKPKWLTPVEAKALNSDETKSSQVDDMDVFVLWATQAPNEAARSKQVAAAALMVKYSLHQLFYPVNLDKTEHPADDPDFYSTLVRFEQRAGLAVDGKFTVSEFEKLTYLAQLENETEISAVSKIVSGRCPGSC